MRYSLYDYYCTCDLTFDKIVNHYISRFYSPKYGENKVEQIRKEIRESQAVKKLCALSLTSKYTPRFEDYYSCIHPSFWSIITSNKTIALKLLFAIQSWNEKVNSVLRLRDDKHVVILALQAFKKCKVSESMSEDEFYEFIDKKSKAINDIIRPEIVERKNYGTFVDSYKLEEFESLYGTISVAEIFDPSTGSRHVCIAKSKDGKPMYIEFSAELGDHNSSQFVTLRSQSNSLLVGKLPSGKFVLYSKE